MPRRKHWTPGNVVEIPLADGSLAYGVVVCSPLMAFARRTYDSRPMISATLFDSIACKVWVMKYAIGKNGWSIVGQIELTSDLATIPTFYRRDPISGQFYHYVDCVNDVPVSQDDCVGLECAAVWDPEHIAERLLDSKRGSPNQYVESMKAERRN